ncbi:Dabb family protein [Pseudarthrobacter defluvii]|uniref:Dabb family protein n=1 Tax=Pseudarthrobacter defluvii TaxID=410837 RepID=UPI0025772EF3|nr:Dabb family protein [Pseudarthrobacter defluvii]WJH26031.1 Dabb family protein [Pseudarthrobacter defluvii]
MIRHTVLFKFKPDFPPEDKQTWIAGLNRMRGNIPGMLNLAHGPDVLGTERSFDYAIVADFETVEDIAVYNTHPLHEPLKAYSFPNSLHILSVDFHLEDPQPAPAKTPLS